MAKIRTQGSGCSEDLINLILASNEFIYSLWAKLYRLTKYFLLHTSPLIFNLLMKDVTCIFTETLSPSSISRLQSATLAFYVLTSNSEAQQAVASYK
jgi:hypothetical protein